MRDLPPTGKRRRRLPPPSVFHNHRFYSVTFGNGLVLSYVYSRDEASETSHRAAQCVRTAALAGNANTVPPPPIDLYIVNTYVPTKSLLAALGPDTSRVLAVPKWASGSSSNDGPQRVPAKLTGLAPKHGSGFLSLEPMLTALAHSRDKDAKAAMYPLRFGADDEVCMNDPHDASENLVEADPRSSFKRCEAASNGTWHICLRECTHESHFCMPGPMDALLRVVLSAAATIL